MLMKQSLGIVLAGIAIIGATGCGTTSAAASSAASAPSNSTQSGQGFSRGNFQMKFKLSTNPSSPVAGKKFALDFSMQRPSGFQSHQSSGNQSNSTEGSGSGWRSGSGNGSGGGNFANGTPGSAPGGRRPSGEGGYGNSTGARGYGDWNSTSSGHGFGGQTGMSAVITGGSVKKTIPLKFANGKFQGTATLKKAGTYSVKVKMDVGQRSVQQKFTLKISSGQ